MGPAIAVAGLTKRFGGLVAVDGIRFAVPRGSVYGFLGPNGSGKTTTLAMLTGLMRPDAGSAAIEGRFGAMVEEPAFYPGLSGRRNLLLLARVLRKPAAAVDDALAKTGLADAAERKVKGYSLGMRRRLGLAAALLPDPEVLVLDEPTSGLDPAGQQEMGAFFVAFARSGRTVLLSSHSLPEVEHACDRAAILRGGRIVAEGPLQELLAGAQEVVVEVDDVARAQALLRGGPVRGLRVAGNRIAIQADPRAAAAINQRLVQGGVRVSHLESAHASLEERFFAATEDR